MSKQYISSPQRTKELLRQHGFTFKKSLGQNFITDHNILQKIADTAELSDEVNVIEIGPGIGALTEVLAESAHQVLAFEIDQRLLPVLEDSLAEYTNIQVVNEDILNVNLAEEVENHLDPEPLLKVVANLPYYITTPIIMHLIESPVKIDELVMMMQKEVAERMMAKPGSKAYGSLSVAIQYHMEASIPFLVPKTVFVPQPNVDSAVLKLVRREKPAVEVSDEKFFFKVVRASFTQRRKTLWNNLTSVFGKDETTVEWLKNGLDSASVDPSRRGETLSIQEFATLANELDKTKKG